MAEPISIQQLKNASLDAKSLEEVINGDENVIVTTRLGETYPSIKSTIENTISKLGFVIIDSFELGATITQRNEALRHTATGKLYRWAGNLPKVVTANSTPTSTGGLGANAWLEVSDATLRQEIVTGGLVTDAYVKTAAKPYLGAVTRTQSSVNNDSVVAEDFGAIGDGTLRKIQEWVTDGKYASLEAIQADYPDAKSLDDSIDVVAIQAATNTGREVKLANKTYVFSRCLYAKSSITGDNTTIDISSYNNGSFGSGGIYFYRQDDDRIKTLTGLRIQGAYEPAYGLDAPKTLTVKGIYDTYDLDEFGHGVAIQSSSNVYVRDCIVDSVHGDCIVISGVPYLTTECCKNIIVENNVLTSPRRCTVAATFVDGLSIANNYLTHNCYVACLDFEPNRGSPHETVKNVRVIGNRYLAPTKFIQVYVGNAEMIIENLVIEGNVGQCEFFIRNQQGGIYRNISIIENTMYDYTETTHPQKICRGIASDEGYSGILTVKGNSDYGTAGDGWRIQLSDTAKLVCHGNKIVRVSSPTGIALIGGSATISDNHIITPNGFCVRTTGTTIKASNNYLEGLAGVAILTTTKELKHVITSNNFKCNNLVTFTDSTTKADIVFGKANIALSGGALANKPLQILAAREREVLLGSAREVYVYSFAGIAAMTHITSWAKGSIAWLVSPSEGQPLGYMCVETSSTGTWLPFGTIEKATPDKKFGTTAQRPTGVVVGYNYFDTTLGKPIYFKSTGVWVDSAGVAI